MSVSVHNYEISLGFAEGLPLDDPQHVISSKVQFFSELYVALLQCLLITVPT